MVFILPNRRSIAFLKKHFCALAAARGTTLMCPQMLTVGDFYSRASLCCCADRLTLLLKLYDCYKAVNPKAESLDDFVYWGDVILSDFDDLDKYRIDERKLLANVSDLKSIQDDYSYADPVQKAAIERLAGHFLPSRGGRKSGAKQNFLSIWNLLHPLYRSFREALHKEGLCYEGMAYRELADRSCETPIKDILGEVWPGASLFVFVGLNALSECEKLTMRHMKNASMAQFCWDFSGLPLTDPDNIAGRFQRDNIKEFGNALSEEAERADKVKVHVVSVPSGAGQAKLLPNIAEALGSEKLGLDFAAVLPDETLLMNVLENIPDRVEKVNVTMGYPLGASEWTSLMRDVLSAQMHTREKNSRVHFYHRPVYDILSSGLLRSVLTAEELECTREIFKKARYYIPATDFTGLLSTIFSPVGSEISALAAYQLEVIDAVADRLGADDALQREFAARYRSCVERLRGLGLQVKPRTWAHLLEQVVGGVSVPFEGEPLGGMQVMGPLETRALDFRNIVIFNSNEGVFPHAGVSSSFIPAEVRAAFALPTYENMDAMWAYYFYRLLSRADNVWMLYDSRTEGLCTGEQSRFIKQLRHIYKDSVELDFSVAGAAVCASTGGDKIPKTAQDILTIRSAVFSPTSINAYLTCPVQFYYRTVARLSREDEVKESVDSGMMGNVTHEVLHRIYGEAPSGKVTREFLRRWLDSGQEIMQMVRSEICRRMRSIEVTGRDLVCADVIVRFIRQVLSVDLGELDRRGKDRLQILGLEQRRVLNICGHNFTGTIDRLDSFEDGCVRIVDYKTGRDKQEVLSDKVKAEDLFKPSTHSDNKAALQFYIYDSFIAADPDYAGKTICNAMYAMSDIFSAAVQTYPVREEFGQEVHAELEKIFRQMEDTDTPFRRIEGENSCSLCDFKLLCGKSKKRN